MRRAFLVMWVAALGTMLGGPAIASAADRWVDAETGQDTINGGADLNPCDLSTGDGPCSTIDAALTEADAADTIHVDGSPAPYVENLTVGNSISIIHDDFVAEDAGSGIADGSDQAVISGGAGHAITVPNGDPAGVIDGFTLRSDSMSTVLLGDAATLSHDTFDSDLSSPTADVSLVDGQPVIEHDTFIDPGGSSDPSHHYAINETSIARGMARISQNEFSGFARAINLDPLNSLGDEAVDERTTTIEDNHFNGFASYGVYILGETGGAHGPVARVRGNRFDGSNGGGTDIPIHLVGTNFGAYLDRNLILGDPAKPFSSGIKEQSLGTIVLASDLVTGASTGLKVEGHDLGSLGDATAHYLTLVGNATDISVKSAKLTLTSSIVGTPVVSQTGGECNIQSSDGPASANAGDSCQDFVHNEAPGFVDPTRATPGWWHLASDSPLIDEGFPVTAPSGETDIDGDPRESIGHDCGDAGYELPDIGADEFVLDCKPPTTALGTSTIRRSARRATFTFSGADESGAVSFQCKLDRRSFSKCISRKTYRNLQNGRHTFQVRSRDASGNVDTSPAKKAFRI